MLDSRQLVAILEPILAPIREGVIITDRNGAILSTNAAVHDLFGIRGQPHTLSMSNLGGFNLRSALIRAGLDQQDPDQHHCEISVRFDELIEMEGTPPRWLRIDSSLVELPNALERLRMIVLRDITAEQRLIAVLGDKSDCGVVAEDPDMRRLIERLELVADSEASILLQGESGTGKTQLARLLHQRSRRRERPFVEINCGSIPASLIESELFGHVKGAFTGAVKDRGGRFRAADGGTLFLDEIGELPRELQPKLLRILQDGEYETVGSDVTNRVDVRVVAASNQDLREMVDKGRFRADLYYRIAVIPLQVPPLRERPGDIPVLVDLLLKRLVQRGYAAGIQFGRDAMRAFMNYPWPGNVRELANAVEHCAICSIHGEVTPDSLPETIRHYCTARKEGNGGQPKSESDERVEISTALSKAEGNKTLAAQLLGVDRSTLWRRMQRLGMTS